MRAVTRQPTWRSTGSVNLCQRNSTPHNGNDSSHSLGLTEEQEMHLQHLEKGEGYL